MDSLAALFSEETDLTWLADHKTYFDVGDYYAVRFRVCAGDMLRACLLKLLRTIKQNARHRM